MNQILVTEKLYVTPELKRKKILFNIEFFLSVFLICILSSYYIYAECDRNNSEQVSQQLLAEVKRDTTTKEIANNDVMIIMMEEENDIDENTVAENNQINNIVNDTTNTDESNNVISSTYTKNGKKYSTEAIVTIPSIGISYPVLSETSEKLLEISVNKYWGPNPNEVGNYCIVGHNYRNGKMFGRLSELVNGDIVELEDLSGRKLKYKVYNRYVVKPTDTRCTSQLTNGKKELTLITCTNYGKERLVVKCREV